jgi:hypothetical protein
LVFDAPDRRYVSATAGTDCETTSLDFAPAIETTIADAMIEAAATRTPFPPSKHQALSRRLIDNTSAIDCGPMAALTAALTAHGGSVRLDDLSERQTESQVSFSDN